MSRYPHSHEPDVVSICRRSPKADASKRVYTWVMRSPSESRSALASTLLTVETDTGSTISEISSAMCPHDLCGCAFFEAMIACIVSDTFAFHDMREGRDATAKS